MSNNVDHPINHISLCTGYGGIDLGLKRAIPALRTVAACEIEAFACANLVSKMEAGLLDPAPIWTDLKTFPWAEFRGHVDILSGGYPCQPFSAAGNRAGASDPRHLWPHIANGIAVSRPGLCFFENVDGHISLGLSDVIEDLAGLGYRATWGVFSAAECGAPHQRKRVFILAHSCGKRGQGSERFFRDFGSIRQGWENSQAHSHIDHWPSLAGESQCDWEPPQTIEPTLGGGSNGSADRMDHAKLYISSDNRTDELRLLGNGVVPATAERAFRVFIEELI